MARISTADRGINRYRMSTGGSLGADAVQALILDESGLWTPGCAARCAFNSTSSELAAMPNPAAHGGIHPTMAKGMQAMLYSAAQSRFCRTTVIVLRAVSHKSVTPERRVLTMTASAPC